MSNFKLRQRTRRSRPTTRHWSGSDAGKFDNEGNVRRAFEALLEKCARPFEWMVCPSTRLHVEYEKQEEYPLELTETGKLDWRVEKMALSKDKTQLKYNEFLTLSGIPAEAYEYRPGNRSALEWVVDQYRVSADARSGIVNDPNREDDPDILCGWWGRWSR